MGKIKLLYDIEQLIVARGRETGICRVSSEVLKRLTESEKYDVYPVVTSSAGDAVGCLKQKGLEQLADKIVYLPKLRKTAKRNGWRQRIKSKIYQIVHARKYIQKLNEFDEYISLFSPISPLVYDSNLKTKIVVHDLIPVLFPDYCGPDFSVKYKNWMQDIKADEVICVSEHTRTDFLNFRSDYPKDKVKVAYLAADEKFKPTPITKMIKEKYGIKTPYYVLSLCELTKRKNLLHVINAFARYLEETKREDVSLILIGPKRKGYDELSKRMDKLTTCKDKIVLTGFVADEDIPALYSDATVFVYLSLYEGFGLPILEAMRCGTPVISADNSSLPEVAGDAALYVSGRDEAETAAALRHLFDNPHKLDEMSKKGIEHAKQFTWEKCVNIIFE